MPILTPQDHDFFDENGYIAVPDIIPVADCEAVIEAIFEFLGMNWNDPDDWYRLPLTPGGMVEMYQHQTMWNNRQNPKLHQLFTEIRGTEKLCINIDRVNFKPPYHPEHPEYDHHGFIHWDVDTSKLPIPFGVQAVLCLADTNEDMGGFQCVPGFHRGLEDWIKTQPADRNPRTPDMTGIKAVPIPAAAGTMIIWNSLLLHGNGRNLSTHPRFSQYISMFPVSRLTEETRLERIEQWQNHHAPYNSVFPGDPRRIEEQFGRTADLTPLGRKLLGADEWE